MYCVSVRFSIRRRERERSNEVTGTINTANCLKLDVSLCVHSKLEKNLSEIIFSSMALKQITHNGVCTNFQAGN